MIALQHPALRFRCFRDRELVAVAQPDARERDGAIRALRREAALVRRALALEGPAHGEDAELHEEVRDALAHAATPARAVDGGIRVHRYAEVEVPRPARCRGRPAPTDTARWNARRRLTTLAEP